LIWTSLIVVESGREERGHLTYDLGDALDVTVDRVEAALGERVVLISRSSWAKVEMEVGVAIS
jgi:hypothetical protein